MQRLRTLGVSLIASLAMATVAATMANGDELTSEKSPITMTGTNLTENDKQVLTTGSVNCKNISYTATSTTPTTSLSVSPAYSNCTAFGFPAPIDTNGCKYIFNIGAATTGDTDISCEAGKSITFTASSAGTLKCALHFFSQSDIGGTVTYSNIGAGTTREFRVTNNLSGLDYSHTKGTGLGACTAGSSTSGTWESSAGFTGESAGSHVGIFLT